MGEAGSDMVFKICGEWIHGQGQESRGLVRMLFHHRKEGDYNSGDKWGREEPLVISQTLESWVNPHLKLRFS